VRPGPVVLLTTPTGRRKDELRTDDLSTVPLDSMAGLPATGPRPTSDIEIHRAIYRAGPEVVAIAHAHLPVAMAMSPAGEIPDPAAPPETGRPASRSRRTILQVGRDRPVG